MKLRVKNTLLAVLCLGYIGMCSADIETLGGIIKTENIQELVPYNSGTGGKFYNTPYQVCFTPGSDCTANIIDTIANAQHSILVQAYSFTSAPIAKAIMDAKKRGIDIRVILDKSQVKARYSSAKLLENAGISTWIDSRVAIAHNKVMIIDDRVVITGSFNFTKAAQYKNAENSLIIYDANLAKLYTNNWLSREAVSYKIPDGNIL